MFGFGKKPKKVPTPDATPERDPQIPGSPAGPAAGDARPPESATPASAPEPPPAPPANKPAFFQRLKERLSRTRDELTEGLATLMLGKKEIDQEILDEIETRLLMADVGIDATRSIIDDLTRRVSRKQLGDVAALRAALREDMLALLEPCNRPFTLPAGVRPYVILMVGINGAGKTTTIGKLAKRLQAEGHSVMLAAGDTFRAAAVEQLKVWGQRNGIPVIAQERASDAASVIFDGMQAARARGADVLIADTAGRLHTQANLMEELKKVRRVMAKLDPAAPHEVMLVLDATTGQNALNQAQQFKDAVGVSGITLTKLDGTAKGGILFAIARRTQIPIRFIGVGEGIEDLRPFDATEFVEALMPPETTA